MCIDMVIGHFPVTSKNLKCGSYHILYTRLFLHYLGVYVAKIIVQKYKSNMSAMAKIIVHQSYYRAMLVKNYSVLHHIKP